MGPNWSLLPSELLEAIAEKVTLLADYTRLRVVCRPWRSACSPRPNHLPLQLPWLMLPYQYDGNDDSTRFFYDLSASKIHKLDLPETHGASICGSSHGWFVFQKGLVVSLQLAFCKIGDEGWKVIEFEFNLAFDDWKFWDFSYRNGFLYAADPFATVTKYNLNNPSRTMLGGGIRPHDMYLVGGVSGDILLIYPDVPAYSVDGFLQNKFEYAVYKFSNDGETKWIKVIDVGQNVLFLGGNYHALSLSSANLQLPEWGANCLCYDSIRTEQWNWQESSASWYNHKIKLARLDDGTATDITGDLVSFQVNDHWQKSLWLTPSLL